jgi:hypothetical protein
MGTTPTATGARPETVAHLRGAARLFQPQKIQQLSLGNVKAETNFVIEVHVFTSAPLIRLGYAQPSLIGEGQPTWVG